MEFEEEEVLEKEERGIYRRAWRPMEDAMAMAYKLEERRGSLERKRALQMSMEARGDAMVLSIWLSN